MAENRKIYLQYREARNSAGELIDPNYDGLKLKIRKRAFKFRDDLISRELDIKLPLEELQYYFLRSFHEILHGYEQTIQEILGDLDETLNTLSIITDDFENHDEESKMKLAEEVQEQMINKYLG